MMLSNVTVADNIAESGAPEVSFSISYGGGIFNWRTLNMVDTVIRGNIAGTEGNDGTEHLAFGGGIFIEGPTTITDSTIGGPDPEDGNTVIGNAEGNVDGGGIYSYRGFTVTNSVIQHNTAHFGGGVAAMCVGDYIIITETTIADNTALERGGGIIGSCANEFRISHSTFISNSAGLPGGSAFVGGVGDIVTQSCIIGNSDTAVVGSVDATNNWWGDASGPSGVGPGTGDSVGTNVTYNPWLISPPAHCNQLLNPSFEAGVSQPDYWALVAKGDNTTDWDCSSSPYNGDCSIYMTGPGNAKSEARQFVLTGGGAAGESFELSAWFRADSFSQGKVHVMAQVFYTDGTKKTFKAGLPQDGTFGWTQIVKPFATEKAYDQIKIRVRAIKLFGAEIWVDDIALVRVP